MLEYQHFIPMERGMCSPETTRKTVVGFQLTCYKSGVIEIANRPYQPSYSSMTAVYRIEVGPFFYIGSSINVGARRSDHLRMLREGTHPNPKLQSAWHTHQCAEVVIIQQVIPKEWIKGDDGSDRAKLIEHREIQKHHGSEFCCNLSASAYFNTTIGDIMRERWKDEEYRARQIEAMKSRRGDAISAETRRKMAEAKMGGNNPHARPCVLTFHGESMRFDTASDAARHFKVSQQVMDLWLRKVVPWPGKGMRSPRGTNKRLIGLTGRYADKARNKVGIGN